MVEYPYEGRPTMMDRETFTFLAKYFTLIPGYQEKRSALKIFIYDERKVQSLPTEELLLLSPYLFTYRKAFAHNFSEENKHASPDSEKLISLLQARGITGESYLDQLFNFEFPALGNESAKHIGAIASDLDDEGYSERFRTSTWALQDYLEQRACLKHCDAMNEGRAEPFTLERVLKLSAVPVAIDYATDGRLYVFDETGVLHEFTDGEQSGEWQVRYGFQSYFRTPMERVRFPVLPNISVHNGLLFLTNGADLERHNLERGASETRQLARHSNTALRRWLPQESAEVKMYYHDVCIREGHVFVSASLQTARRYLLQVNDEESFTTLYTGVYPRNPHGSHNLQDLTLRLGFFNGNLYFPEGTGISAYTPTGNKEMLQAYQNLVDSVWDIDPITKFAFGRDFMVAIGKTRGWEHPLLQLFKPVYQENNEAPVRLDEGSVPERFERFYVTDVPKKTGHMLRHTSITAMDQRFAFMHTNFKRVLIYKMQNTDKMQNTGS